jgi:ferric-dicitrate binding protein FerR (iron transport regulator)
MNQDHQELIDRYLNGSASDDDIRQLDELAKANPAVCDALVDSAAVDVQLRRLVAGRAPASIVLDSTTAGARSGPSRRVAAYAALLLMSLAGWLYVAYLRQQVRELQARPPVVEPKPVEAAVAKAPKTDQPTPKAVDGQVVDIRGLVYALPNGPGEPVTLTAGANVPEGRALWTCPWGAASFRFPGQVSMQMERSTTVALTEADGMQQMNLREGTLFITKEKSPAAAQALLVSTAHASVKISSAQVAVATDAQSTVIEVAVGSVEVRVPGAADSLTVPVGHYLIVGSAISPRIEPGRLIWRLEPAK